MSREYVYQQKSKVTELGERFDAETPRDPVVVMDKETVEKLVLCMALHGNSPYEGIRQTFKQALGYNISTGRVSGIIKEAAERAKKFDEQK